MSDTPAVETEGLAKHCGRTLAPGGLDLRAPAGMSYGLPGPNGAGQITAVRIFATLAARTAAGPGSWVTAWRPPRAGSGGPRLAGAAPRARRVLLAGRDAGRLRTAGGAPVPAPGPGLMPSAAGWDPAVSRSQGIGDTLYIG